MCCYMKSEDVLFPPENRKTQKILILLMYVSVRFCNHSVLFLPQVLSFHIVRTLVCHSLDTKSVTKAILLEAL